MVSSSRGGPDLADLRRNSICWPGPSASGSSGRGATAARAMAGQPAPSARIRRDCDGSRRTGRWVEALLICPFVPIRLGTTPYAYLHSNGTRPDSLNVAPLRPDMKDSNGWLRFLGQGVSGSAGFADDPCVQILVNRCHATQPDASRQKLSDPCCSGTDHATSLSCEPPQSECCGVW